MTQNRKRCNPKIDSSVECRVTSNFGIEYGYKRDTHKIYVLYTYIHRHQL